jgi:hypothetical protein
MIVSAQDILNSISHLGTRELGEQKSRHPKHEFQAFAYKIAHDLSDLENLHIYMHLLKKVDRYIIEQAYGYIRDSQSANKKKLFLWKLKELRTERKLSEQNKDFSYKSIIKRMKIFRDRYSKNILGKYLEKDPFIEFVIKNLNHGNYKSMLLFCVPYIILIKLMCNLTNVLHFYDYSKSVRKLIIENLLNQKTKIKHLGWNDPLKPPKDTRKYQLIILDHLFSIIPFDFEDKFWDMLKTISDTNSEILMRITVAEQRKQEWVILKDTTDYYFSKKQDLTIGKMIKGFFVKDIQLTEHQMLVHLVRSKDV